MSEDWVDFKEIKANVTIQMVLDHYGVNWLKRKKDSLVGKCPIHKGNNDSAFNVSLTKNNWNCFTGCKRSGHKSGGNIIDFVVAMEGLPDTSEGFRDAALKLKQWFLDSDKPQNGSTASGQVGKGKDSTPPQKNDSRGNSEGIKESPKQYTSVKRGDQKSSEQNESKKTVNPPLTFALKNLDTNHAYLKTRGLTAETIAYFGIGLYKGKTGKELMANRVAIPIHNEHGDLVAYGGRAIAKEQEESDGKYKLPPGFQKSHVLFNLNRAKEVSDRGLILVEGFFDVFILHQLGYPNVVALMGSSMSSEQESLLLQTTDRVVLMFDGDQAGRDCTRKVALHLVNKLFVRIVRLPDGKQPEHLTVEAVKHIF